jgi:hypothetical protein
MDAVLLIAGLFVLWIWLHGHPIGALVAFLAVIFSGSPDIPSLETLPKPEGALAYLAIAAAVALAPMAILWLYRDLKKGRRGRLAHLGDMWLTSLAQPPVPKAQKPKARGWAKEEMQAYSNGSNLSDEDLELWTGGLIAQLERKGLERGEFLLTGKVAPRHAGACNPGSDRPRIEPALGKPVG